MRALVTGGAGFIGSNLVDALLERGDEVAIVDDISTGRRVNLEGALERGAVLHEGSLADPEHVAAAFAAARPEIVYHLGAQIDVRRSVTDPAFDAQINVVGTAVLLEAAREAGVARFLMASTGGAIYGEADEVPATESTEPRPLSPYATSKQGAEGYLGLYQRLHGLSTFALRLANVYGPRQDPKGEAGVCAIYCGLVASGGTEATVFGDGLQTRDFVYVGDVVAAFVAAGQSDATGFANIGTGRETTVLELATELGLTPRHEASRAGEVLRSCLDPTRAGELFGWSAQTSLADGLKATIAAAA